MIKRLIKNKISDKSGVSIVIALFALIVIIAISTLMLNSAFSNIGRVRRNQQAEQNYLTEASAVQLIKDCLSNVSLSYDYLREVVDVDGTETIDDSKTNQDPVYTDKLTGSNVSPFKEDLTTWFTQNAKIGAKSDLDKYYYVKLSDSTGIDGKAKVYDVVIHARMDGKAYPTDLGDPVHSVTKEPDSGNPDDGHSKTTTVDTYTDKVKMFLDFYLNDPDSTGGTSGSSKSPEQNYLMNMTVSFDLSYTETVVEEVQVTETTNDDNTTSTSTTTTTTTTKSCGFTTTSEPEVNKGASKTK